jgi:protein involved in polysaccharide export with SLBB domain
VGPGDEILIRVFSAAIDFDQSVVVGRDGTVPLPKIGPVMVAGKHMSDLEPYLKGQLSRFISDFNISVTMGKLRGIEVYVVGQARAPGKYVVSSVSTLINALFATGGPNNNGSLRNIQLVRAGKVVGTMDLYGFLSTGDTSKDMRLEQGDAINIQRIGPQVALMGSTPTPAVYELLSTDRPQPLFDLIQISGGVPAWTSPLQASLERIDSQKHKPLTAVNLVLDARGLSTPLRDGDIVTLFPVKPAFGNAVTLHIADATPIRLPIEPGAHIRDIIPSRDALLTSGYYLRRFNFTTPQAGATDELARITRNNQDQINWGEAIIERITEPDQQHQVLSFNLDQAVKGDPSQNLALMPGDIITIFTQKDVQVPLENQTRMVRLQGEVKSPGIYQLQPGETLRQLVERAGGLTDRAYIFGTDVSRVSVKAQQLKNLDTIIRQMETQLNGNLNQVNLSTDSATSAQNVIERRSRLQFEKKIAELRSIKPNGRVVMEMDPYAKRLPDFVLENGDEITIPNVPGSVMAVGAVYNENSLIYRPKRTTADYLKVAGVTPQAEEDKIFVVHADGSIVAPDNDGWFRTDAVKNLNLMPGDTIVVPEKYSAETGYSVFMRGLIDWSQVLGQIGLAAVAIKVLHP